ncbi:hypothetical protein HDC94_000140 [Leifsonia sp. AK011]|uniref:DUF5979 domain-containing protein n=1 Tax=Leifsonia sp. AK011 TaxID=2723075 RepID=UPI0015C99D59|nr:DUF5979 domain-containing protein [Leifsonia sp. AK011]NYF08984.1 hypothetical protein [Leifsonia sp. AK011]
MPQSPGTAVRATRPTLSHRLRAGLATLAVATLALVALPQTAFAASGSIESPSIEVASDGNATTSPVLDDSTANGIVGTNDTVCFNWSFASAGVTDGTFSQTLPAGWTWTASSLSSLQSNSSLYTSSYQITGDPTVGQTLTATVSVPDSQSIIILGPLCAVPSSTADLTAYTPTLVVEDGAGPVTVTAPPVTVVGEPKMDLAKYLYRAQSFAQHDFGSGPENAMYIDFRIAINQPTGTALYGSTPASFPDPFLIDDNFAITPTIATTDLEVIEVSQGTATLIGTDISVSGATDVGNVPWGATMRMWFRASELPTENDTPAFIEIENTAGVQAEDATDVDLSNNTAIGSVQGPILGEGIAAYGKELLAANDPQNPVYNIDPWGSPNYTDVTGRIVSPGAVVFSRFYLGLRDQVTGGVLPATNVRIFDFWDPTQQRLHGAESDIYVGGSPTAALPSSEYEILYTNQDGSTGDPAALTWFPRTDPAFSVSTVRGISIRYVGNGAPDAEFTNPWFLASVPLDIVALPDVTVPDTARYLVDQVASVPPVTRFVNTSTSVLAIGKTVDLPAITSGSTLTYTLTPTLSVPLGGSPSAVTGLTVVDQLPTSVVSVNTSGLSSEWSVVQTPGDPGPDGIQGTSDDVSGISLEFTYAGGGEVTTGTPLAPIVFTATTSLVRPATGVIINTATVSADQNNQAVDTRSASAVTTVGQANILAKTKVADDPQIEVREPIVSWTSSWVNFQSEAQGPTSFVDVLPYNGDGRGTSFNGTATLSTATMVGAQAGTYTLEYTTDAPASVGTAPATATTWIAAPTDGNFASITGVTALRVSMPEFAAGEAGVGGLKVALAVVGQLEDDVYANTITGRVGIDPVDPTAGIDYPAGPPALVDVVASDITGTVWRDEDGDGTDNGEPGIAGVTLALQDAVGTPIFALDGVTPLTTVTAADGTYSFTGLPSGSYRVVATPPAGSANTYDLDGTLDSNSGVFTLGVNSETNDVDFGYQFFGGLVINKVITGPGGDAFGAGPFDFDVVCTFEGEQVLSQTVTLTPIEGATTVTSEVIGDLPAGASCTVTETDNGGADVTPAPITVEIVDDATVIAELTNHFSSGVVQVAKVLEGDAADLTFVTDLEFEVLVTCQVETTNEAGETVLGTVYSGTVLVRGGQTVAVLDSEGDPVGLPLGAHCFGEETEAHGADTSSVDHDSFESAAVVGTSETAQTLTITATNTFDLADITVEKIVKGVGSAGPFTFELECTRDGLAYPLEEADEAFTLSNGESRTIQVLVGTECAATETNVPETVIMTVSDTDDSTEGGDTDGVVVATHDGQTITVTNLYPAISGDTPGAGSGLAFTGSTPAIGAALAAGAVLLLGLVLGLISLIRRATSVRGGADAHAVVSHEATDRG